MNEFDCLNRKMRTLSAIDYDEVGKVLSSFEFQDVPWEEVVPESVGELELDAVCAAGRKP